MGYTPGLVGWGVNTYLRPLAYLTTMGVKAWVHPCITYWDVNAYLTPLDYLTGGCEPLLGTPLDYLTGGVNPYWVHPWIT